MYGPNFHGSTFDPKFRNIYTSATNSRAHHCENCNGKLSRACYSLEKLHFAYCQALVVDRDGREVICGEQFQFKSPNGRAKHHYPVNKKFRDYQRGVSPSKDGKEDLRTGTEKEDIKTSECDKKTRPWWHY